jgi:hypothetical protein
MDASINTDKIDEYNGWYPDLEKKVKKLRNSCYYYNHEHEKIKIYLTKKTNLLLISSIVISSLVAIISTIASLKKDNYWLIIVSAILSGLGAGISFYTKTDQSEQKLLKHSDFAKGYRSLVLSINCQLLLSYPSRTNADIFIKELTEKLLELESGPESIPLMIDHDIKKTIISIQSDDEESEHVEMNNVSPASNKTFELFDRYDVENKNMVNFQLERLHNV